VRHLLDASLEIDEHLLEVLALFAAHVAIQDVDLIPPNEVPEVGFHGA